MERDHFSATPLGALPSSLPPGSLQWYPQRRRTLEQLGASGRRDQRPAVPPVGIVVVNLEPDAWPTALLSIEPRWVEAQHERPHHPVVRPAHLPTASRARRIEPPVRIIARRLPPSGPPAISKHTATASDQERERSGTATATNAVSAARSSQTEAWPCAVAMRSWGGPQAALSMRPSAAGGRAMGRSRSVSDAGGAEGRLWSRSSRETTETSSG